LLEWAFLRYSLNFGENFEMESSLEMLLEVRSLLLFKGRSKSGNMELGMLLQNLVVAAHCAKL